MLWVNAIPTSTTRKMTMQTENEATTVRILAVIGIAIWAMVTVLATTTTKKAAAKVAIIVIREHDEEKATALVIVKSNIGANL